MTTTIFHYRDFLKDFLAKELVPPIGWSKDRWDAAFGLCMYFDIWLMHEGAAGSGFEYIGARLIANGYTITLDNGDVGCPAYPFGVRKGYNRPERIAFAEREYEWAKEMANYCEWLQKWEADPSKTLGLCNGLYGMLGAGDTAWEYPAYLGYRATLRRRLSAQFEGSVSYPFGGDSQYYLDSELRAMHLNPQRIAFVRSELAEFGL